MPSSNAIASNQPNLAALRMEKVGISNDQNDVVTSSPLPPTPVSLSPNTHVGPDQAEAGPAAVEQVQTTPSTQPASVQPQQQPDQWRCRKCGSSITPLKRVDQTDGSRSKCNVCYTRDRVEAERKQHGSARPTPEAIAKARANLNAQAQAQAQAFLLPPQSLAHVNTPASIFHLQHTTASTTHPSMSHFQAPPISYFQAPPTSIPIPFPMIGMAYLQQPFPYPFYFQHPLPHQQTPPLSPSGNNTSIKRKLETGKNDVAVSEKRMRQ